ncbi:MAG: hypothetical protein ACXAE3_03210 [Candidatus Kariarchaeaceae archaeon]|jgi:hypothetical protein
MTPLRDSFVQQLYHIFSERQIEVHPRYLYGRLGMGARFTLAMNTRTTREIGHPSSHYIWDIVGVIEHCFPDAGLEVTAYVGEGYASRARDTAAQTSREIPPNVQIVNELPDLEGDIVYVDGSGVWKYTTSSNSIDVDLSELPFGPVVLVIGQITVQHELPKNTLSYLIDTLERGEAPMEIRGTGDYSAVSGWKAFARWMQSFSIPLQGVQHDHLETFPALLLERRGYFAEFLEEIAENQSIRFQEVLADLAIRYRAVQQALEDDSKYTLERVRELYFIEQKTLTSYKKLANLLRD